MVYGFLHVKIREKGPRDQVTTFSDLLSKARLAEEIFIDSVVTSARSSECEGEADWLLKSTNYSACQGGCITFVMVPGAKNCTLLGIDFIIDTKIQLNIADRVQSFADDKAQYDLEFKPEAPTSDLHVTSFEILHPEKGQRFVNEQRLRLLNYLDEVQNYLRVIVNSDKFCPINNVWQLLCKKQGVSTTSTKIVTRSLPISIIAM
ncbi:hypothetical protein JTB14_000400 [Gonioctena quinquepunctata]|nr:hypothetical protein JTB14_000400 [Gonioctena quinquepunctata]